MDNDRPLQISDVNDILTALPTINENATFWMIRANKGEYYTDFVMNQYVGIGYDEISLKDAQTKTNEQMTQIFHEKKPKDKDEHPIPSGTYTSWIGQLRRFANEIKPGDYVLVPGISSDRFSLGVVLGQPFEITSDELNHVEEIKNRKFSPYKKRIKVQFLRSFNRSEADPALYKMIYTQTTVSKIDKYIPYILRAVFDAYISGKKVYLTFPVTQKEDIEALPYTEFTYNLTASYSAIAPEEKPIIKNNVQSAGVVQLILALSAPTGIFGLTLVVLRSKLGFTIDVNLSEGKFRFIKEANGVVAQRIKNEETDRVIKEQNAKDDHLEKMIKLANQANVPMDDIKAKISSELIEATKKAATPDDDNQDNPK